jgi:hypothetical protein
MQRTPPFLITAAVAALAAAGLPVALTASPARAQAAAGQAAAATREYQIKAAFIYNFVKYVDWPGDKKTLTIGVLGRNPFGSALDALSGKTVNDRTLTVRRIANVQEARAVDVLFVSSSESEHVRQIIEALRSQPVLTVGEVGGFAQNGGVINFTNEGNKVRFEINPDAAERARLKISSQLLRLAKVVRA